MTRHLFIDEAVERFADSAVTLEPSNDVILSDSRTVLENFKARGFKTVNLLDYQQEDPQDQPRHFVNRWQKEHVNEEDLLDLFEYEGISIWHMLHPAFYRATVQIFNTFKLLRRALKDLKVDEFMVISCAHHSRIIGALNDRFLSQKIAVLAAEAEALKITRINHCPHSLGEKWINRFPSFTHTVVALRFFLKLWKRKWASHRFGSRSPEKPTILFMSASHYWRSGYNPFNHQFERVDPFVYPLIHELGDDFRALHLEPQYMDQRHDSLKEKAKKPYFQTRAFESYVTLGIAWRSFWAYRLFLKRLHKQSALFKDRLFVYEGVNLYPVFEEEMLSVAKNILYAITFISISKRLVALEKPMAVFLTYETDSYERSLIYACQKAGVPTFGLQHGGSYPGNPDYARDYDYRPDQSLLPDYFVAYGNQTREVLEKDGYPMARILPFGSQEYDFYKELTANREKRQNEVFKRLKLPTAKKIILFISTRSWEGMPDSNIDYHRKALYEAVARDPDCFLIIKLHPDESKEGHERILASLPGMEGRYTMTSSGAIAEYVLISDLAIMFVSTAGYEAIMMDVPLISINFTNYVNYVPYVQSGVIPVLTDPSELEDYLKHYDRKNDRYCERKERLIEVIQQDIANYPDFDAAAKIVAFLKKLIS